MRNINVRWPCLAAILVCAFASGCGSSPVYDESWAERVKVKSGSCPVLDGEYLNAGEQGLTAEVKTSCESCARKTHSLAGFLNLGNDYQPLAGDDPDSPIIDDPSRFRYQSIRLRFMDDNLHVEALLPDGSMETFDKPIRQKCRDSILLLKVSWDGMGSVPLVGFVNRAFALGKAQDGSLLVRSSTMEGLFLLEWPLYIGTDGTWTRFAPVTPSPAPEELSARAP